MDTILAVGAHGECPEQLIALLGAAGYTVMLSPDHPADTLTPAVMDLVKQAQQDLDVPGFGDELAIMLNDQPAVVKGAIVTQATWDALRVAAARRTGLVTPAEVAAKIGEQKASPGSAADTSPAPGGGDTSPASSAEASPVAAGDEQGAPEGVTAGEQAAAAEAAKRLAAETGEGTGG